MKKDIKDRWVERLPHEEQITGHLGDSDGGRCCLGVLCDMAVEAGVIAPPVVGIEGYLVYGPNQDDLDLPDEVMDWAGLDESYGARVAISEDLTGVALTDANDGTGDFQGLSFEQIARLIRDQL